MRVVYDGAALLDTAAIYSLFDETDRLHAAAREFFTANLTTTVWFAVNTTSHECYTRIRYDLSHAKALAAFGLLRGVPIKTLPFEDADEANALQILRKYDDQALSFQDALCAAVMKRVGIYKVFTFDADFWTMGFQVIPGTTRPR